MKKWILWISLALLLGGCGGEETFETVADEAVLPVMANPRQITVRLPQDMAEPMTGSNGEQIYVCEDHEIIIETLASGDLNGTFRRICGYEKEDLTVMQTQWDAVSRYDFVWAVTGEEGDRLGRAVILDDGQYHYCMSILEDAGSENDGPAWETVFSSFGLT